MSTNKNHFEKPELSVKELSRALYQSNMELQNANLKLVEQERQRLEFYANISHDLRAPITALSNSVEYMLSYPEISSSEIMDNLKVMQKRIDYMKNLIQDIFLLSSLDSSDTKVHKEQVDMRFFLEDFFYLCCDDSRFQDADLRLNLPEDMNITMRIDPVLMHRVLANLFDNALKYSHPPAYIELGAVLDEHFLSIYVQDHGIGIADENLQKIFDRSYMVQQSRTPGADASSGFGLSIVKSVIEHHNGTITCESKLNKGSRFIIKLPL